MEVILLDLCSLNYVITLAVTLIASHFYQIPWKRERSVATGKFRGSARNYVVCGKLWAY